MLHLAFENISCSSFPWLSTTCWWTNKSATVLLNIKILGPSLLLWMISIWILSKFLGMNLKNSYSDRMWVDIHDLNSYLDRVSVHQIGSGQIQFGPNNPVFSIYFFKKSDWIHVILVDLSLDVDNLNQVKFELTWTRPNPTLPGVGHVNAPCLHLRGTKLQVGAKLNLGHNHLLILFFII